MADLNVERTAGRGGNPLALAGLALALMAGLMLFLTGPGARFGFWHFRVSFAMMGWAGYLAILAGLVCVVALAIGRKRGMAMAVTGLLIAALVWFLPWNWRRGAREFPPIHDITTDTRNPPAFVAVAPLRADAPNPVAYEGDSIARIQLKAYPDLNPLMMAMPLDSAFRLAVETVREMDWELVDQNRREGRIEATATTGWYGFKDDVVVRVISASGIARVDVRSKSRVGRGDVGANAARIREYLAALRAKDPRPVQAEAGGTAGNRE